MSCLDAFEKFLHADEGLPILITAGLAHAQFETIHPFLDGNGRVGRLLITFILCYHEVLHQPLLYLSLFLRRQRAEYYDRLTAIRRGGDWEGWLRLFLRGVGETAEEATTTARAILLLREQHQALLRQHQSSRYSGSLLDLLFERPHVNVNLIQDQLGVTYRTAAKLVDRFVELGLLEEITGGQRNRRFRYSPYLALFS